MSWPAGYGEKDDSPYADLISIDGFQTTNDKKAVTNLPTIPQAIRCAFQLFSFMTPTTVKRSNDKADYVDNWTTWGASLFNVIENAGIDPRDIYQVLSPPDGDPRHSCPTASIGFNDGTGKQRLLRIVASQENKHNSPRYCFWAHYVDYPDATTKEYTSDRFGTTPIYLSDIAEEAFINRYATDFWARQGVVSTDSWIPAATDGPARQQRTVPDPTALNVTNYYYDINTWHQRSFNTDMWNAPVLLFRTTRVYDRGDEYATVTVDGLNLCKLKSRTWESGLKDMDAVEILCTLMSTIYTESNEPDIWFLDGKGVYYPSWKDWGNANWPN